MRGLRLQEERTLFAEVQQRLPPLRPQCLVVPIPNGAYIPAYSAEARKWINIVISQMVKEGQLLRGAADLVCLWDTGSACFELKRPAASDLFGKRPAGRPSDEQKGFAALCAQYGVNHFYASSWEEVRDALVALGRLP